MSPGDLNRPRLKLGARPLEAVITVAHSLGGERWEAHVVLTVGSRKDDCCWTRVLKDDALEGRQTRWIQVFDDLHDSCRVEPIESGIAVYERSVQQLHARPRRLVHLLESQTTRGGLE